MCEELEKGRKGGRQEGKNNPNILVLRNRPVLVNQSHSQLAAISDGPFGSLKHQVHDYWYQAKWDPSVTPDTQTMSHTASLI